MDAETCNEICPVCTLYLRPGITLKSHLNSHPKQKVIEALINLANAKNSEIVNTLPMVNRAVWNQGVPGISNVPMSTANHSFIYQHFMSSNQPNISPQYITIPTVFNSSLMCPPYIYQQQQQVFMSTALAPNIMRSKSPVIEEFCETEQSEVIDLNDDDDNISKKDPSEDEDGLQFEHSEDLSEDKDESIGSPDYLKVRQDLNKACQTRQDLDNCEDDNDLDMSDSGEFNSEENVENSTQCQEQVLDLNGVQVLLCNDIMENQVISQVHEFECNNEQSVLMNIGNNVYNNCDANDSLRMETFHEDSLSCQSGTNLSIRADENMPPRGELSGQESNGTSDMTWNHAQYDSTSAVSYNLFARETWQASDGSDRADSPPVQSNNLPRPDELDDTPTIISVTEPPLNFKCPTCGKGFSCPKERKTHQAFVHNKKVTEKSGDMDINLIGTKVPTKSPVKKLVIKPKKTCEIKNENNFEELFNTKNKEGQNNADDSTVLMSDKMCNVNENCFDCLLCGATHSDMKSLRKHKQVVHGTFADRFKCETCGEGLQDKKSFLEHLRKHPLECKLCGKYFYKRQNIRVHMKRHLGIKPFVCEFCQKPFFSKQKLFEHRNIHTGEAPIKCNFCDETFKRYSNLVQHRNVHHFNVEKKVKDYICHCGEVLHSKKKLAWHKEIHDTKPKACTKCNEKFVHMASLTRHMRRSHNDRFVPEATRSSENVECPICKNVYLKSSLDAHIQRHNGKKAFKCTICNKEFSTKWNLKLHKWTHASRAAKPFKCEHCNAAFIRESEFTAHMNAHKCVRPYTCNHCGAQFIRKSNCQRHVKEHEHMKTFTCQLCGKSFHRSYYLNDHMRVHSGVRPYACHICGKTSSTKSNHNKHILIHHAKEPISTEN